MKGRRTASLTPEGRRALKDLDAAEAMRRGGWGGRLRKAWEKARKSWGGRRPEGMEGPAARRTGEQIRYLGGHPEALRATAYVSYDLPQNEDRLRRVIIRTLLARGFRCLQESLYTGPAARLTEVIAILEPLEALPFLRWGLHAEFSP